MYKVINVKLVQSGYKNNYLNIIITIYYYT